MHEADARLSLLQPQTTASKLVHHPFIVLFSLLPIMSGIEVAGLVFGVLLVIFETIRGYSKLSRSLHTFRYWSKEVDRVSTQLKLHNGIFLNECRLLLRLIEDDMTADNLLKIRQMRDGRARSSMQS